MGFAALAERSGVPEPTVKRILGGGLASASFGSVVAIAEALGLAVGVVETSSEEFCRRRAREKARRIARLVQGTSALESQAIDEREYERLVERSFHELMAGPKRRLWAE